MADDPTNTRGRGEPVEADDAPGTLSRLIQEVVRGATEEAARAPWSVGLKPGLVVGRYELLREVGRGGFGVVFEARDRELGRRVAFKALRVGGDAVREGRLLAEAEVAARLAHPNIVTVLDVGRSEHGVFLVQEFLAGEPLTRRLAGGRLPVRESVRIAVEVARGLAHAHAHGVVHRDLSPGNVLLCDDGQVKILDLGMAAALGRRKVEGGTPAYMAPEQATGAPEDERTDVYALGALLYRMLTGVAPVEASADGRPRSQARGLEVPEAPALAALVEGMLASAPADRPRDAGAVLEGLQRVSEALPRASGEPSRVRVRPPPRHRWVGAGALAGLLAAALVGLPAANWWRAGAVAGPAVMAGGSAQTPCAWRLVLRTDFDTDEVPHTWRNGKVFGQALRRTDGVPAWYMGSDWNQLFIRLPEPLPDVFAVQVQLLAPPPREANTSAGLIVFTDPVGPLDATTSDLRHGRGVNLSEDKGHAPYLSWGLPQGEHSTRVEYRAGTDGPFTGTWRTLRLEGSRSGRWLRLLLDGRLLVADGAAAGLDGRHLALTGQGDVYGEARVQWKHLMVFEGGADCR